MPAVVVPALVARGPGYLFRAVLGSAVPTNTVIGGVFTDAWPAAWIPVGATRDGSQFNYELTTEDVVVAEYLDPLATDETGRNIGVGFDLANITDKSYLLAMGGGSSSTVSGSGATLLTKVSPPAVGGSTATMIGWESQDYTQRVVYYVCKQSGNIQWSNTKTPNYQSFPLTFKVNQPTSGNPFDIWIAGATRVAAA
jgi:hypothetical protein